MAAVPLFRDTNMATATTREDTLHVFILFISTHGSRGFTKYWDGGSQISRIMGSKRNIGANSNLAFPM